MQLVAMAIATIVAIAPPPFSRRAACVGALTAVCPAIISTAGAEEPSIPKVTQRVSIEIAIGLAEPRSLSIGLFGEAAPASTKMFSQLCTAQVPGRVQAHAPSRHSAV